MKNGVIINLSSTGGKSANGCSLPNTCYGQLLSRNCAPTETTHAAHGRSQGKTVRIQANLASNILPKGLITWRISARSEFFWCDYMASFSPGFSAMFSLPQFCVVEYSITALAQAYVSTRAEILLRLHEVFQPSNLGCKFSPRADISAQQETFKRVPFRFRAEISARLTGLKFAM